MQTSLRTWLVLVALASAATGNNGRASGGLAAPEMSPRGIAAYPATALDCFQMTSPVMTPEGTFDGGQNLGRPTPVGREGTSCQIVLMDHIFANSYDKPYVADYAPPSPSSCEAARDFNRVVVNFTVVSEGRQFDRLAIMWLGDIEVWRTSTAEPKPHPGIAWTYWKDMSNYLALWKQPQKLIFDLGNLINDKYTGSFNATLTATFFSSDDSPGPGAPPADQILPISARRAGDNRGSAWTYPDQIAEATVSFPRSVKRAVVSVSATGQSDEEFWWSNVPENGVNTFNGTTLLGKGAFREVRLMIDNQLAGLSWPFPVVFTGGISPPLHRPMVGLQAFDLREQEIDVTPWLGVLCDGKQHTLSLKVVGADDAIVNRFWLLSAKAFLWLDGQGRVTSGDAPAISLSKLDYQPRDASSPNEYLRYNQTASRSLIIQGQLQRGQESSKPTWSQTFVMENRGTVTDSGNTQDVTATYKGEDKAESDTGVPIFFTSYAYPIASSLKQTSPNGDYSLTLDANLTQQLDLSVIGLTAFPNGLEPFPERSRDAMTGSRVNTTKTGRAFFWEKDKEKTSGGFGSSHQRYDFGSVGPWHGLDGSAHSTEKLYWREAQVVNETVTEDRRWTKGFGDELSGFGSPGSSGAQGGQRDTFAFKPMGGLPRQEGHGDDVLAVRTPASGTGDAKRDTGLSLPMKVPCRRGGRWRLAGWEL